MTRLFASLLCLTMAGTASAEIVMDGDRHFGLFPTISVATPASSLKPSSPPSFRQPLGTGIILRGNARFGLLYQEQGDAAARVTVSSRLRLDIDISHATDSGVTFGGRVRAQANGGSGAGFNAPTLYATWD